MIHQKNLCCFENELNWFNFLFKRIFKKQILLFLYKSKLQAHMHVSVGTFVHVNGATVNYTMPSFQ
jgi:hypothetical protein